MATIAKSYLSIGIIFLLLTIINGYQADIISPSFQRAEVLSSLSSVCLMLVAFLWEQTKTRKLTTNLKKKKQGLFIQKGLPSELKKEIAWGSHVFLTATPASTVLIYWNNLILLHRGILGSGKFIPGSTCNEARIKQELISLANAELYPGRHEFEPILENLPSLIVYPLLDKGWIILGGCSKSCFSKSDEKLLICWAEKLLEILLSNPLI